MSKPRANAKTPDPSPRRKALVLGTLVVGLGLTSVFLLAVSPPPLTGGAAGSLFAVENAPSSLDRIFLTAAPQSNWKYIYIHHTRTPSGNAQTLSETHRLGDHFLLGNGDGMGDGEIQIGAAWERQQPAAAPPGADFTDPRHIISIGIVGDFDRSVPTSVQMRRLGQLVGALQVRHGIAAANVLVVNQPDQASGIGRYFPATAFRGQLLQ